METRSWNEFKILLQTSASVQGKVPNEPIKSTFGSVMSFVDGSGAEPQPKLKLVPFQLQNLGFLWHHFAQIMKTFEISLHILQTFNLNDAGHYIHDKGKSIPLEFFCSFWKISKSNFTDILGILYAYNSIITIRLAYSVLKLSVLQWCNLAILACSNYRWLKITRRTGWKQLPWFHCQRNVASKFTRIEPVECLWNCPKSITIHKPNKNQRWYSRTQGNDTGRPNSYNLGSDRESCKSLQSDWRPVL